MKLRQLHGWDLSPADAIQLQATLQRRVDRENRLGDVGTIAGVDVGIKHGVARAAVVALRYPELEVAEIARAEQPVAFPYVPGLLAFREAPVILEACETLRIEPDLFIFDGQGLAHPRRFGIACHVGLWLDKPAIGCAKSRLHGGHAPLGQARGAWVPLIDSGETIGAVVRTRPAVKPVYVSIGHRVDLETAIRYVLATSRGYRLPEPCRLAHQAALPEDPNVSTLEHWNIER